MSKRNLQTSKLKTLIYIVALNTVLFSFQNSFADLMDQTFIKKKLLSMNYSNLDDHAYALLSKKFTERLGNCYGYATLWLFSKWLQFQPQTSAQESGSSSRDDFEWFQSTIINPIADSSEHKRLISLVDELQTTPDNLEKFNPHNKIRGLEFARIKNEYSISALLTLEKLTQLLKTEGIIQEDKLILILAHQHATALFKHGSGYYYYDSNNPDGEMKVDSLDEIVRLILSRHFYCTKYKKLMGWFSCLGAYPVTIQIFSINDLHNKEETNIVNYPEVKKVLSVLDPPLTSDTYAGKFAIIQEIVLGGSQESLEYFLKKGADANQKDENGFTPLFQAIGLDKANMVKALVDAGADPYYEIKDGINPLAFAIFNNRTECFKLLIKEHDHEDKSGMTPLMRAMLFGNVNNIKTLIDDVKEDPNYQNKNGNTPLLLAVNIPNNTEIIEALIDLGADPNRENKDGGLDGFTPLMAATASDKLEYINTLIAKGADPYKEGKISFSMFAIRGDKIEAIEAMIKAKKENNHEASDGKTLLMYAVDSDKTKLIEPLIRMGENPNYENKNGATPLIWVARNNKVKSIEPLVKNGANPNYEAKNGMTALLSAAPLASEECIESLIKVGADPNQETKIGLTPLLSATTFNKLKNAETLVTNGASPNYEAKNNQTALLSVLTFDREDFIDLFISRNITLNYETKNGMTPLLQAVALSKDNKKYIKYIKKLVKNGADPEQVTKIGTSPILYAKTLNDPEIIEALSMKKTAKRKPKNSAYIREL